MTPSTTTGSDHHDELLAAMAPPHTTSTIVGGDLLPTVAQVVPNAADTACTAATPASSAVPGRLSMDTGGHLEHRHYPLAPGANRHRESHPLRPGPAVTPPSAGRA